MVIYFVVGIRFEEVMLMDTPTSVGKFVVLLLVHDIDESAFISLQEVADIIRKKE